MVDSDVPIWPYLYNNKIVFSGVLKMMASMTGKVALITGGASGIGRAAALLFAREGANVVICDIAEGGGRETVQMVEAAGTQALFVRTDVTVAKDLEGMVSATMAHFGRLDAALNNAGHPGFFNNAVTCTEDEWDHVANIDLKSIWLSMKYQIPAMLKSGGGSIVNTATAGVHQVVPSMAAFTAFKHGVVGLTKSVAKDFAAQNVRANVLMPGPTLTKMMQDSFDQLGMSVATTAAKIPMNRMGRPEEQAEAAVWLCSPRSSFVTGVELPVDGGWSL